MMASRTATNDRINEAVALLLAGRSASGIVSEMADKYGVTRRQARRYVGRGYEIIRDDIDAADVDREKLVSQLVNSLQESLAKAAAAGHICAVVSCARELRELLGLAADATPKPYSQPTPYRIGHGG